MILNRRRLRKLTRSRKQIEERVAELLRIVRLDLEADDFSILRRFCTYLFREAQVGMLRGPALHFLEVDDIIAEFFPVLLFSHLEFQLAFFQSQVPDVFHAPVGIIDQVTDSAVGSLPLSRLYTAASSSSDRTGCCRPRAKKSSPGRRRRRRTTAKFQTGGHSVTFFPVPSQAKLPSEFLLDY